MNALELKPLTIRHLPAILELDQLCFGGLWTPAGYQRELDSPKSDLIGLFTSSTPPLSPCPPIPKGDPESPPAPPASPASPALHLSYEVPSGGFLRSDFALLATGCFWTILDEAHITILAVHPLYQRQGLGQ
ncbi:MAG: hypothetical protein JOZ78_09585, partial [Chroococcidiopsidaceae cyanobacterium CP_BM_ER_R8_30]|nr:hypothetical protein [Chroococcidiopsidaceae cyanobacterium CP_BM_ER_R8_30]